MPKIHMNSTLKYKVHETAKAADTYQQGLQKNGQYNRDSGQWLLDKCTHKTANEGLRFKNRGGQVKSGQVIP